MNSATPRFIFAALCLIGLLVIALGAAWEWRRQTRGATISARHFRWRMISALLWCVTLGSLAYATLALWPTNPHDHAQVLRFGRVLSGSLLLMLLGFVLMAFDFYLTAKTRQLQTARMRRDLDEIARQEIERARPPRSES